MSEPSLIDPAELARNLAEVQTEIAAAAKAAEREAGDIGLVAVSKTHPAAAIEALHALGQRRFGENRVQEAQAKYGALRDGLPGLELHLIGPLQTNKLRDALALFDVIETVDRPKLAEAMAAALQQPTTPIRMRACFIQVNTGEEPQKAGIMPHEADDFIRHCREDLHLPVAGLMAIPPAEEEPSPHFAWLRCCAKRHGLRQLSMGMSADYPVAIGQGATLVRVGTAIFGHRPALR
ncbi:MAG TPA: YggS family pyridoxal phosphate-dependent enzyme [Stellaceae bacterium]|nr:YggS family pyridoxal phosphate-dependent enzyme [Stellaceae bacterium]